MRVERLALPTVGRHLKLDGNFRFELGICKFNRVFLSGLRMLEFGVAGFDLS